MKRIFSLLAFCALFTLASFADVRLPDALKPTPDKTPKAIAPVDATMNIRFSNSDKTARLIIPRSQLKQLRAELEELDGEAGTTTAATAGLTRTQTVASGAFLSLAFVFGGVWFVRAGKAASKKGRIAAAGAFLFFSGAFATIAFANIAPPQSAPITSRIFDAGAFNNALGVQGPIKIEISDSSSWVQLVVPRVETEKPE
jgi:hypothetical protein